jgi:hypothetical protein
VLAVEAATVYIPGYAKSVRHVSGRTKAADRLSVKFCGTLLAKSLFTYF